MDSLAFDNSDALTCTPHEKAQQADVHQSCDASVLLAMSPRGGAPITPCYHDSTSNWIRAAMRRSGAGQERSAEGSNERVTILDAMSYATAAPIQAQIEKSSPLFDSSLWSWIKQHDGTALRAAAQVGCSMLTRSGLLFAHCAVAHTAASFQNRCALPCDETRVFSAVATALECALQSMRHSKCRSFSQCCLWEHQGQGNAFR